MAGIRSSLRVFLLPAPTIQNVIIFAVHLYRKTEITGAPIDKTAILIPCYNEEKTIDKVVGDWKRTLLEAAIYIFYNNSTDQTVEKALRAGAVVRSEYL